MAATAYVALQQPATLAEAMQSACLFERVEELKEAKSIQQRTPTVFHELREQLCELAAEIKALTLPRMGFLRLYRMGGPIAPTPPVISLFFVPVTPNLS